MSSELSCPSVSDLQTLLQGLASEADTERWTEHLEHCERCQETARALQAGPQDELIVALANSQASLEPVLSDTTVAPLIDRMKSISRQATQTPTTFIVPANGSGSSVGETVAPDYWGLLDPPIQPDELGRLGAYRVLKLLGIGGMGVVFEAEDSRLMRRVALKVMIPSPSSGPANRQRFLREARLAAAIEHEHIITVFEVGEERGTPFLAMQLLNGETLQQRLDREPRLPLPDALRIAREIAEGLAAAHARGLLHRDIKPANVFLSAAASSRTPDATRNKVKLLDFGLARLQEDDGQLSTPGTIAGTPSYMSPEQASGASVDPRSDLFSLGSVLYRMLCGVNPFTGTNSTAILLAVTQQVPQMLQALNPLVPAPVEAFVLQLLAKDPAQRPASADAVVQALEHLEREVSPTDRIVPASGTEVTPLTATKVSPPEPAAGNGAAAGASRKKRFAAVALLGVCAIVGLLSLRPWQTPDAASKPQPSIPVAPVVNEETQPAADTVLAKRADEGFHLKSRHYEARISPTGSIDELTIQGLPAIRGISLGKMSSATNVTVDQQGLELSFASSNDYWIKMSFQDEGFTIRVKFSELAGQRDGDAGLPHYLYFLNRFTPQAQLVKSFSPADEFVLPVTSARRCDDFQVTFANGSQLRVSVTGDMSFPNDPGAFSDGSDKSRYAWARGSMKPEREYQFTYQIRPGQPHQSIIAMPPLLLQSSTPARFVEPGQHLTFTARMRREDGERLKGRENRAQVRWKLTDLWNNRIAESTGPLKDVRRIEGDAEPVAPASDGIEADWATTFDAPTGKLGWFRLDVALEDAAGEAIPNRVEADYGVLRPGILPDLSASERDLYPGFSPDKSAWLGFGLVHVPDEKILPQVAECAERTGINFFYRFALPSDRATVDEFANHVRQVVSANHGNCRAWEILHQPDEKLSPERYFEYLQAAHAVIKEIDPDALVLGPSLMGFNVWYLERLYQLGGGKYLDAVTLHPYTSQWRGWVEQGIGQNLENLRAIMRQHGDESKPVWFTGSGFPHTFVSTPILEVQARFTVQMFLLASSWGIPPRQVYYSHLKAHGWDDAYVVRYDDSVSPAALGMRTFGQQTHGLTFADSLEVGKNRLAMRYAGADRQVVALFSYDFPTTTKLRVDVPQVKMADFFGNEATLTTEEGELTVPISGYPVYLSFPNDVRIVGVPEDWEPNLALGGTATASSGQETAAQVVDHVVTARGKDLDSPGWASAVGNQFPQWVEVKLPSTSELRRLCIYTNSSFCAIAGPRDFDVQIHDDASHEWKTIASEQGNVDRWVFEYVFESVAVDRVRVVIRKVNNGGLRDNPHEYAALVARISEIEAYGQ